MAYVHQNQMPVPRPSTDDPLRTRCIQLAGRLAAHDDRLQSWADQVGVECGPLDEQTKYDLIVELDAVVAHLYGLTEPQLEVIYQTHHNGTVDREPWGPRYEATLQHYRELQP